MCDFTVCFWRTPEWKWNHQTQWNCKHGFRTPKSLFIVVETDDQATLRTVDERFRNRGSSLTSCGNPKQPNFSFADIADRLSFQMLCIQVHQYTNAIPMQNRCWSTITISLAKHVQLADNHGKSLAPIANIPLHLSTLFEWELRAGSFIPEYLLTIDNDGCTRSKYQVYRGQWNNYTGWWFEPLWKIWKSIGMIIPNIWENKKWQPNHQPAIVAVTSSNQTWHCGLSPIPWFTAEFSGSFKSQ